MNSPPLVARWDAFLAQIGRRFYESLTQAEAALLASLATNGYDIFASLRAQTAMSGQIEESLIRKIDDTWREQVLPAMERDGDYWIHQIHKGPALELELQRALHLWEIGTAGKLSELYYAYAIKLLPPKIHCSQCRSPIILNPHVFQAQYVACAYCNTVNTFVPETKYALIQHIVDNIAAYRTLDTYLPIANHRYSPSERTETPEKRQTYNAAVRAYCEAFCRARIALHPEKQATYDADLATELFRRLPAPGPS